MAAATRAVYDGFCSAVASGPVAAQCGVILDERFATPTLADAMAHGFTTACTVGTVGDARFDTEFGDERLLHAAARDANYWRVVVRFNPTGGCALTPPQLTRLRRLSDALHGKPGPKLMCDLVVPPTQWQLARGIRAFDQELLPDLTRSAMARLVDTGIAPAVWAIEGFERQRDYHLALTAATRLERNVVCMVRAAGHSDATTFDLMTAGLATPGVAGVILGPAPFWEPVVEWMRGQTTRARAVAAVTAQVSSWIARLEDRRAHLPQAQRC